MKSFLLLLLSITLTAGAQSGPKVSLSLGSATVWLGMDKATAKRIIEAASMIFPDDPSPNGQVLAVDVQAKRIYTLKFNNGKLVYADRNWLSGTSNVLTSVMDALSSLIDQGATKCTITHAPISSPTMKANRVFIDCGDRGILLSSGVFNGMTDDNVSEIIGHYR